MMDDSMMIRYEVACAQLLFEILTILCISNILAEGKKLRTGPLLLAGSIVSAVTILYDYLVWYCLPIVALALCVLSLKLLSSAKLWEIISNLICGVADVFLLELLIRWTLLLFRKDGSQDIICDLIISAILLTALITILILYGDRPAARKRRQALMARKKIIQIISISLIVPVIMLSNVFLDKSILFFGGYHMFPFLAVLYFVMSLFLIRYFMESGHKESQLQMMNEYGTYLNEVIDELHKKEHEHKNQLNTIISIAEMDSPGCREQIIRYTEGLCIPKEGHKGMESIVSDNSVMAAWLFKMSRTARLRGIQLDCYVAKPFPVYRMPEQDLIELLANLVNNALESAACMPADKKFVSICLEELCIEVANYVNEDFDRGILKKSKAGFSTKGYGRGYGMSNIRDIVKKYGGTMETYLRGDLLTIVIHMSKSTH